MATENGIEFGYAKCCYNVIPCKGIIKNLSSWPIFIEGHGIAFISNFQNLSVTIDSYLSWMPHLDLVQEIASKVLHKMNFTAVIWSIKLILLKMLYALVEK